METTFPRTHYIPRDMLRAKTGMIGFTDSHKNRRPNVRFHFYVVNTTKMKLRTPVVCEVAELWPPSSIATAWTPYRWLGGSALTFIQLCCQQGMTH
jgi:hypothetical protein